MCKVICVTNRKLCGGDFLTRIERVAAARPDAVILREKDLPEPEYTALAEQVTAICQRYDVQCILHSFAAAAVRLRAEYLHLPLPVLRQMQSLPENIKIGVSCHSEAEAQEAVSRGANYLIAGHIFATDCKKGLPGRGTDFLRAVCRSVNVPVYAIGGIAPENAAEVMQAGAAGFCIMSGLMQCDSPANEIEALRRACHEA